MIASFIITFRETLEAALVVGIVLSYLARVRRTRYYFMVFAAVATGSLASLVGALLFNRLAGGFTGRAEEIFEGVLMLAGAFLLTSMIIWMGRQRHMATEIESRVATHVAASQNAGLFLLVFSAILREGVETVIFLGAAGLGGAAGSLPWAAAGILAAILAGYAAFRGSRRIRVKTFFTVTTVVLVLFAAGLVGRGIHELEEAQLLPSIVDHVWDLNPPLNADGSYPLLHEDGVLGSIFSGILGYNGNPSLLEVIGYLGYLAFVWWLTKTRRGAPLTTAGRV
jgi:high-affinity iron transporter